MLTTPSANAICWAFAPGSPVQGNLMRAAFNGVWPWVVADPTSDLNRLRCLLRIRRFDAMARQVLRCGDKRAFVARPPQKRSTWGAVAVTNTSNLPAVPTRVLSGERNVFGDLLRHDRCLPA